MKNYLLGFIICLLSACSAITVLDTESAPGTDFSHYKTYNFYAVMARGDTLSSLFEARLGILKEAISHEMEKRGFVQTTTNPGLLVNIGIAVKEKVTTRETDWRTDGAPRYMGQRNYSWKSETIETGRYRQGTARIELVDAAQNKMVWKGVVQGVVPGEEKNVQAEAQKGMEKLFARFPVAIK